MSGIVSGPIWGLVSRRTCDFTIITAFISLDLDIYVFSCLKDFERELKEDWSVSRWGRILVLDVDREELEVLERLCEGAKKRVLADGPGCGGDPGERRGGGGQLWCI